MTKNDLTIKVRKMKQSDLDKVVSIHHQAFPDFFMTLMGSLFLKKYYLTVMEYKESIALVHLDNINNLSGFAVGFIDPKLFYKFFMQKFFRFLFPIAIGLILKPYLLKRILIGFFRVNNSKDQNSSKTLCELSSIGVAKKGSGIGKILLVEFINECFIKGSEALVLATDLNNNENVIAFYKSIGFKQYKIELQGKREMAHFKLLKPVNRD